MNDHERFLHVSIQRKHPLPVTVRHLSCSHSKFLIAWMLIAITWVTMPIASQAVAQSGQGPDKSSSSLDIHSDQNAMDPLTNSGRKAARGDASQLNSVADGGIEAPARPATNSAQRSGSRFGAAFKTSTLGLGADFGIRISRRLDVRLGAGGFNYHRLASDGDIAYNAALRLRSVDALLDWFPFSRGFHISPGLLLYDGTRVSANAVIPPGKILTSGTEVFVSDPRDPIAGSAKSTLRRVAPMTLFGFGSIVPRTRRFGFSADFGVVFQGLPQTNFTLLGTACDTHRVDCRKVAHDASIQADVRSGEQTIQNDLSFMRFYPVVSLQFGYRF